MSQPAPLTQSVDVVVAGGGPAGSTIATMLARRGYRVLVLEREHFPREHVGESLLPASVPLFEELGVREAIEAAGFLQKWGAVMVWGSSPDPWSWYFKETNQRYPYSYQVERPRFDQILLENSARQGAEVRQGSRVLEVLFADGAARGVRFTNEQGEAETVSARFVADASGQTGLLGRSLGLRRADPYFRNLAVYGYFSGAKALPPPDDGSIFIESYQHGWCWGIPLHKRATSDLVAPHAAGLMSVGVVVDSSFGATLRQSEDRAAFFREQLAAAPHMAARLMAAQLESGPFLVRDWSYLSNEVAGDGYVLAGDAAFFVDPLFSSGVHLALSGGMLAAAYIHTALKAPALREAAGQAYKTLYSRQYSHFRELARLFYSSNRSAESYFWEARRLLGQEESATPREAFIAAVAGQPLQGYERAVIERGEAPELYVRGVQEIEQERAARAERFAGLVKEGTEVLLGLVPVLCEGAQVEQTAVLGDGEFVPGFLLRTPARPEGVPLSGVLARFVTLIDGQRSVAGLLAGVAAQLAVAGPERLEQLTGAVLPALRILYVEGAIDELREP